MTDNYLGEKDNILAAIRARGLKALAGSTKKLKNVKQGKSSCVRVECLYCYGLISKSQMSAHLRNCFIKNEPIWKNDPERKNKKPKK